MEFYRAKKSSIGLDMAPLIDVVFLLLIFFMLASSFLQPSLELNLPKAVQTADTKPQHIVVSVDQAGRIFVNTDEVAMSGLKSRLAAMIAEREPGERDIHLRGDENMPYKTFVEIMDQARQAGAGQVNIVHSTDEAA